MVEPGKITAKGMGKIFTDSSNQAETYAILYGILEAQKRGHQSLEIWSDAKNIVEACTNPSIVVIGVRSIILDILSLLSKFNSVILIHVPSSFLSYCSKERVKAAFYVVQNFVKKKKMKKSMGIDMDE